jgi:hypothetical protein
MRHQPRSEPDLDASRSPARTLRRQSYSAGPPRERRALQHQPVVRALQRTRSQPVPCLTGRSSPLLFSRTGLGGRRGRLSQAEARARSPYAWPESWRRMPRFAMVERRASSSTSWASLARSQDRPSPKAAWSLGLRPFRPCSPRNRPDAFLGRFALGFGDKGFAAICGSGQAGPAARSRPGKTIAPSMRARSLSERLDPFRSELVAT